MAGEVIFQWCMATEMMAFSKVRTNMYIELTMEWRSKMLWNVSATNSEIANTLISKFTYK